MSPTQKQAIKLIRPLLSAVLPTLSSLVRTVQNIEATIRRIEKKWNPPTIVKLSWDHLPDSEKLLPDTNHSTP